MPIGACWAAACSAAMAAPIGQGYFLLAPDQYRIEDNWQVVGLCGTGSKNVIVNRRFRAPASLAFARGLQFRHGRRNHGQRPSHLPGPALRDFQLLPVRRRNRRRPGRDRPLRRGRPGCARPSAARPDGNAGCPVSDRPDRAVGCRSQRSTPPVRSFTGTAITSSPRCKAAARFRSISASPTAAASVSGCGAAKEAVDTLFAVTGAAGLFSDNPIQRHWRDVNAVAHHLSLDWNQIGSLVGGYRLGVEPAGMF